MMPDPIEREELIAGILENREAYLESMIREAEMIVSRHDGVHSAHGALANLRGWMRNLKDGMEVDFMNAGLMIEQLRIVDKTGVYPK